MVFEVVNNYEPLSPLDLGGISITKGDFVTGLYEYASELEDRNFRHTRVYKDVHTFYGEGSEDGLVWVDKSEMRIPKADTMGVSVEGEASYTIEELKIYKEPFFYIADLYGSHVVNVYDMERTLLKTVQSGRSTVAKVSLPSYPFTGIIEVMGPNDKVEIYQQVTDLWGGDYFISTLDIDLFDSNGVNLRLEEAKHLGKLPDGGIKYETITVVNNGDGFLSDVGISILKDSPAYDWVEISEGVDTNGVFGKEISLYLRPRGTAQFLIRISKPPGAQRPIGVGKADESFYLGVCGGDLVSDHLGFLFAPEGQIEGYRGVLMKDEILKDTDRLYR